MESYFDIATPKELYDLHNYEFSAEEIDRKRDSLERDPDRNFQLLAHLYAERRDYAKTGYYLSKINDDMARINTGRVIAHNSEYIAWCKEHGAYTYTCDAYEPTSYY